MRRRRLVRAMACLFTLLAMGAGALGVVLQREPTVYREIVVPEGPERRRLSGEFSSNIQRLMDSVGAAAEERWSGTFTVDQINSYFAEDFVRVPPFKLPKGVHSPRINIRPEGLTLAFRFGHGFWSTVITIDLNCWLIASEPNLVAIELVGVHAGAVPISPQSVLEQIAEQARQWNLEVNWYRHGGHPVALVRIQPDRPMPSVLVQRLELQDGKLLIEGKSTEPAAFKSMISFVPAQP